MDNHRTTSSSSTGPLKKALVTGASRGIGASVALQLAEAGVDVAVNYRSKGPRATQVAEAIRQLGRCSLLLQADITNEEQVVSALASVQSAWGSLDILVLNASGGLERDKPADYAVRLNVDAQINLVLHCLPLMNAEGRIVFVTSHLAHFSDTRTVYEGYAEVARSKKLGEDALRNMIPTLAERGVKLAVVSGDLIEGTITPKLLQRESPGLIDQRRSEAGSLPNVEEFAAAIVHAATNEGINSGATYYVGNTD
jgi:NAD(P)-dependent dehydrogenase (short-subunit alcohol dehydrogenase family)